jgi:hypothetical protein
MSKPTPDERAERRLKDAGYDVQYTSDIRGASVKATKLGFDSGWYPDVLSLVAVLLDNAVQKILDWPI